MEFLRAVAQDIKRRREGLTPQEQKRFAVVFPNKRSMRYFRKYYSDLIDRHEFLTTIPWQQFLDGICGCGKASQMTLIAMLYKIVKQVFATEMEFKNMGFDEFFGIGQTILSDFNEIDNYLIDARKIFLNVYELEQVKTTDYLTEEQLQAISSFWQRYDVASESEFFKKLFSRLSEVYEIFVGRLQERNLCYSGLRNKKIVSRLEQGEDLFADYNTVAFVGFYALSKSERKIFDFLKKQGKALFYWDYDEFYVNDTNEAGLFLNMNLPQYPDTLQIDRNRILSDDKRATVIGVPRRVAQARLLPQIFKELGLDKNPDDFDRTAVVLLDESLLFPVLYSLPDYVPKINITLQFPLRLTALYSFFDSWFYVIGQMIRGHKVYYRDFNRLLRTEIFRSVFPDLARQLTDYLSSRRMLYVVLPGELKDNKVFSPLGASDARDFLEKLLDLVYAVYRNSEDFDREYIYAVYTEINRFLLSLDVLEDVGMTIDMVISVLRQIFYSVRVPFEGNTIEGLQIMTIMETRSLDFKNLIMLGMNEGIFPQVSRPHSFFTETVRRFYGLPVLKYQDSLYAYMFYRLLQGARNIYLVYNSIPDAGVEGKSRFILQLQNETSLIRDEYDFAEELNIRQFDFELPPGALGDNLPDRLKILSASAITTYLTCPRKFFYTYVAGLQVPAEESYEIAVNEFGNIVHKTLELFYSSIIDRKGSAVIKQSDIKEALSQLEVLLDRAMESELGQQVNVNEGTMVLMIEAVRRYVRKVLEYDRSIAPFEMVSMERDKLGKTGAYYYDFRVNENLTVKLQGVFDRLHKKDGIYYIVDYKTGAKKHDIKLDKLFEALDNKSSAIFQLLFYALIYKSLNPHHKALPVLMDIPSLFSERNFSPWITVRAEESYLLTPEQVESVDKILELFEQKLRQLLNEIFSSDQQFNKTTDTGVCDFCPFREFCEQ